MTTARVGALLWIALGVAAGVGGWRLGIGSMRATGPGLFPFGLGLALVALGIASAFAREQEATTAPATLGESAREPKPASAVLVPISIAMVIYVVALSPLGFTVATFGFVGWLVKRTGATWKLAVGWGAIVAAAFTLLFAALSLRLPTGVLGGLLP